MRTFGRQLLNLPRARCASWFCLLTIAAAIPAFAADDDSDTDELVYEIEYIVTPEPESDGVQVEMRLSQKSPLLRELDMRTPKSIYDDFRGDGEISTNKGRTKWQPPAKGGSLKWFAKVKHRRNDETYDAYMNDKWALFRADDIFPAATTRATPGAESRTRMRFDLTGKWSSVTQYQGKDHEYAVINPERRFDRPTGWVLLGRFGVRSEDISGVHVRVAAPLGHSARRLDILAMLQWNLPGIVRVFPEFPQWLTLITAREPMWRGGLSAPQSLFVHGDRPMISENGTSTLLHELIHVGSGIRADDNSDWIVEGIAEYYSLEIMRRTGTISQARFDKALEILADWGKRSGSLCESRSSGASTALAATVMHKLNLEIEEITDGDRNIDDVAREVAASGSTVTLKSFTDISNEVAGKKPKALSKKRLPGCQD